MTKYMTVIALLFLFLVSCNPAGEDIPTVTPPPPVTLPPVDVDTPTPADVTTPTLCPQATPELLRVRPVTSPTGELQQTVLIDINNGESVMVRTASGTFEARPETGDEDGFLYNFVADIKLQANTTHELTVDATIREIEQSGCTYGGYTLSTTTDMNGDPLVIVQETDVETVTPIICPQATPELLRVRPVTSPTGELKQTVLIDINNGESVTVSTASGIFEARPETGDEGGFFYNFVAEIDLLPDTTHELTVEATIREIEQGGCTYGGYILSTTTDMNGDPLVIVQDTP